MGLKVSDVYSGEYLRAEDLGGQRVRVEIASVSEVEVADFSDKSVMRKRLVLTLRDKKKKLMLGKRNATILKGRLSNECDAWVGKTIEVYAEPDSVAGVTKDVLKVALPQEVTSSESSPGF